MTSESIITLDFLKHVQVITQSKKSNFPIGLLHRDSGQNLLYHNQKLAQASPAIQQALLGDDNWNYDIVSLEKVTNKR